MLKLTHPDETRDPRDVLRFPSEAARFLNNSRIPGRSPDRAACAAARKVEAAMAEVERRFARLRLVLETPEDGNDRPRAA